MFFADWRIATVILIVFIACFALMGMTMGSQKGQDLRLRYQKALGHMNSSMIEYVRGIQVVKIFNRSSKAFEQLNNDIDEYRDLAKQITRNYAPSYLSFYMILSSILLLLIPLTIYFLEKAPVYAEYVPTVLLFLVLGGGLFFPLMKLMWMSGTMMENSIGITMIDDILFKEEIEEPATPQQPQDASIEFNDVCFAYDQTEILKKVSFQALPGTITALVGPSGAGKSTIAMLTARFWDISSGEIRMGGTPIKDIRTEDLMNHVAFVFQDNMLLFDTIEENIRMGNKEASFEQVVAAAKAAQCHEFIEKLDKSYRTLVGEGGTYLSGGEQQRIALARAILKDAPVILLDEATAYADPENEGKILESFSHLIKGKTVLIIAHRLSTITGADQILVVNEGEIQERGTHEELLQKQGQYATMWSIYSQSREWRMNV